MIVKQPLLPLEHFRQLMGFNPWHFWGWSDNEHLRVTSSCSAVVSEYAWQQTDAAGRADIAEALTEVQKRLFDYLNFEFAPVWKEVTLPWPRYVDHRMNRTGPFDADGRWMNIQLPEGYIQALGVETLELVQPNVAIVYQDNDGDGLPELAVLGPIATTVTDPNEIALYVSAADRTFGLFGPTLGDQWRIEPLRATIANGQLTVRAPGYMFMKPVLREGYDTTTQISPATTTNFLSTIDVYRRYTDGTLVDIASSQGVIIWETRPVHGWWCQCGGCSSTATYDGSPYDPAATAKAAARVGIRDARNGAVIPAQTVYNPTTGTFEALDWSISMEPDRITVRYRAGVPFDDSGWVDPQWRTIVARYAAAELNRSICGCEDANRQLFHWQQDLTKIGNAKDLYQAPRAALSNPLGTRRGHLYAWNQINTLMMTGGTLLL